MTKQLQAFYLLFCVGIAFVVWMLGYGLGLQLFYKDGRILETTITSNPFAPIQQFWHYKTSPALQKVALGSLVPAMLVAGLVAYIGLKPTSSPLGDAAFQDMASLRRGKWFRKQGHIFGRVGRNILRTRDDRHHLIIGPTRSGKGAGYVIPNALMHEGSMIVTDLKGEVFKATAGYRRENGSQVFLFAPGSEKTSSYNPLDFIRPERGNRTTDIQNIASILVPENTASENSVWQATAQQVLAGAISYITESPFYKDRRNLAEVNSFFNSGVDLQALMKYIKEKEPYLSKFTVESFNSYIALSERAAASALLDIQKAMRPFKNERIVAATNVTDMDLRAMKRRPISIYLAPNITDITLLRPLLTLFVQQVMDILTLEHDPNSLPVYFLLDEFRQLKRMDEIMTKLPYVAGYNIKLAFIIQDLKNLDEIYGETSRHSLLGNCGYQLVLGANDQATAEYASRALGKRTIRYQSESRTIELMGLPRRTKVEQIRERDLMMPQEVRQMPENKMILLIEGQRPIFGEKLRFFQTQPFKSAEAFSQANIPRVPEVDYLSPKPVPATTPEYAKGGEPSVEIPSPAIEKEEKPVAAAAIQSAAVKEEPAADDMPSTPAKRTVNRKALRPSAKATAANTGGAEASPSLDAMEARIRAIEEGLKPKAAQLREVVEMKAEKLGDKSPTKRRNIMDIFSATVPDPVEVGVAAE
ncbi:type IV secretory system conjugative DNA transfer family protein [Sinorhizobium meliloti]|uniref:type IV secretory system conjugative DNA transfer family protein n=1 Tax=Rhizobium meliloti TaxID=382 RepID=UPI000FDC3934|nr:type IV secretory system conjugative DNA transfer family protein [Sinorhizobium meliloti]MDX0234338.1 type IV secretion system DNA-binding domain-containing protein [Sinorhizobium meliloti]RVO83660.1 type IV secretory system conjugative DNA transfer family protein [Sinorhizobium meliloti]RVQ11738.1 type IV secretory system conjugative DNA transfer family protein [Sinorhizobium meliloti]WQP06773.1 type IV secretory system conjugative DNA transfer family protein [Sinorhizobium meliloti]WQP201